MKNQWIIIVGSLALFAAIWLLRNQSATGPVPEEWLQTEVANESRPVLVKFGAEWCGPCRVMDKSIESISSEMSNEVKFIRVDVDHSRSLANHFNIHGIPRTLLFHQGKVIADETGSLDADELKDWIQTSVVKAKTEQ